MCTIECAGILAPGKQTCRLPQDSARAKRALGGRGLEVRSPERQGPCASRGAIAAATCGTVAGVVRLHILCERQRATRSEAWTVTAPRWRRWRLSRPPCGGELIIMEMQNATNVEPATCVPYLGLVKGRHSFFVTPSQRTQADENIYVAKAVPLIENLANICRGCTRSKQRHWLFLTTVVSIGASLARVWGMFPI